LSGEGCGCLA